MGHRNTFYSSLPCAMNLLGNDSPSESQSLLVSSMTFVHLLLPSTFGGSSLSFEIYVRRSIVGANSCGGVMDLSGIATCAAYPVVPEDLKKSKM